MRLVKILSVLLVLCTPAYGMSKKFIELTQYYLNQMGFDAGEADGIYGNKTKRALENFYANRGQKFDGILDDNEREDIVKALTSGVGSGSKLSSSGYSLISNNEEYLGCWGCSSSNSDSICNEFGKYGNQFSSESIWMSFGKYGNQFSSQSPWNQFSSRAPKLFDTKGVYQGRFSINQFSGFKQSTKLKEIYDSVNGNLSKVRNAICK